MLRGLVALALMCGLAGVAKAQAGDFQMVVIDPTYTGAYSITPITSTGFTFTFSECESPGQLPLGVSYDGCFTGQNETGEDITSLMIQIPVFGGQTAGCNPSTTVTNLFTNVTCGENADDTDYILNFSGGDIPSATATDPQLGLFTIAEDGVVELMNQETNPFPTGNVVATVPESRSLSLLAVDVLMCVGFIAFWGRRAVRIPNL
jgi:hypothetical protein